MIFVIFKEILCFLCGTFAWKVLDSLLNKWKYQLVMLKQWSYYAHCYYRTKGSWKGSFHGTVHTSPVTLCAMCRGPWNGKSMNDLSYLNKSENIKYASFNQTYNTQSSWLTDIYGLKMFKQTTKTQVGSILERKRILYPLPSFWRRPTQRSCAHIITFFFKKANLASNASNYILTRCSKKFYYVYSRNLKFKQFNSTEYFCNTWQAPNISNVLQISPFQCNTYRFWNFVPFDQFLQRKYWFWFVKVSGWIVLPKGSKRTWYCACIWETRSPVMNWLNVRLGSTCMVYGCQYRIIPSSFYQW